MAKDVERRIRSMFRMRSGNLIDAEVIRLLIAEFMTQRLGVRLTAKACLRHLNSRDVLQSQLTGDMRVGQRLQALNGAYVAELNALLINRTDIVRHESATVTTALLERGKHVMLEGLAGSGKSCILAQVLKQLDAWGVPSLVLRLDQLTSEDQSARAIATRRELPDSPVITLGEFAGDQPSVLCIDQIDSLSLVSGRQQSVWGPFNELLDETRAYPNMQILFACRRFDLEFDPRIRELAADQDGVERICVQELTDDAIRSALKVAGVTTTVFSQKQMQILSSPLHLYLFLEAAHFGAVEFGAAGDLFDAYWEHKERAVSQLAGRSTAWIEAIGSLCDALSDRESLIAPTYVMDGHPQALQAIASEGVVHVQNGNVRFFHESFFDYAFARTFLRSNSDLVQWLVSDEQHLFRRSQVRQVLAFLRDREPNRGRYLQTLKGLLENVGIRFHIKKLVLDWLGTLSDPTSDEWCIVEDLTDQLDNHAWGVVSNSVPWFDVLQGMERWKSWLTADDKQIDRAISLFRMPDVLNTRSAVVAELVDPFRGKSDEWQDRLRCLAEVGYGYTSPEMQALFISLIADGSLDYARPRCATNDTWWNVLYRPSTNAPEFTTMVLGAWFDRQIDRAAELGHNDPFSYQLELVTYSQFSAHVIEECSTRAPREFVRELFPRLASFDVRIPKRWIVAPGMHGKPDDQLREALAKALILIVQDDPAELDSIMGTRSPSDGKWMSALVLRSWSANPDYYAERIVRFLLDQPVQRLSLGYDLSTGETDSFAAISRNAVAAASPVCSDDLFADLESSILYFTADWERKSRNIGRTELVLLRALDQDRILDSTLQRIRELERRFPEARERGSPEPPHQEDGFQAAISPIPTEALPHMSDTHWLSAMAKYSGDRSAMREGQFVGGALELSRDLERSVREDPGRFSSLATLMDATLPPIYFEAVLRGLTTKEEGSGRSGTVDQVCSVLRRIAEVGAQVPGREIASAIGALAEETLPDDIVQMLVRVALDDPDPESDKWQDPGSYGDPVTQAINSARGAAAMALGRLLFADNGLWTCLKPAIERLVEDPVLAVRSVAVESLLAILDSHRRDALACFARLAEGADPILGVQFVDRFLHYAIFRDYPAMRPILLRMLESSEPATARAGAKHIALAALWVDDAREDGNRLLKLGEEARVGAATIYANNLGNATVRQECEERLRGLFTDDSAAVRREASTCWFALKPDQVASRGSLIGAFAKSMESGDGTSHLAHRLKESRRPLPPELCDVGKSAVAAYGSKAASIQFAEAGVAHDLAPLMVRLHEESSDPALRKRILDVIDDMVRAGFYGIGEQLTKQYDR